MDHRKLRRRLRKLAHAAEAQFPYLNYGGCCVFAAAVATELERHGVRHEVITTGSTFTDLRELRPESNTVDAWNSMGVGFGHVGVRMKLHGKWFTYDSARPLMPGKRWFGEMAYSYGPFHAAVGGLTAAEATELADENGAWNPEFCHRVNTPLVREMVERYLR